MSAVTIRAAIVALVAALVHGAPSAHDVPPLRADSSAAAPRLFGGTGTHRFSITTSEPDAQRYFDQGLILAWGFNFAEAERSFRHAAELDPQCAMCRWGVAYARGPSINHDIDAAAAQSAREALAAARTLAQRASPRERTLIGALSRRYRLGASGDAYAAAMAAAARRYAHDADVLTLYAEALMTPHGRDYWRRDGKPQPWTPRIVGVLERALERAPDHPGANHYYVHVFESAPDAHRALAAAERLQSIAPAIGHLVHMPAHIYFRTGRYRDAVKANEKAIAADRAYLDIAKADTAYISGYVAHNYHFLAAAAMMAGQSALASGAAAELSRYSASLSAPLNATQQHYLVLPLYVQLRFGLWEAIDRAPRPAPASAYTDGVWHYARAMAHIRGGNAMAARSESAKLEARLRDTGRDAGAVKNAHAVSTLLQLCTRLLQAELAHASGEPRHAIAHARAAVKLETTLEADEPPVWPLPARHVLAALLLENGRAREAERVYREDLAVYPDNGWALAGLAASLDKRGEGARAARVRARAEKAWSGADVAISASRF